MDELSAALERASVLIHRFGATVRSLRPPPESIPCAELLPQIKTVIANYPTLTLDLASTMFDSAAATCHLDWLVHCVDYAARLYSSSPGRVTIDIISAKSVTPPVEYYAFDKSKRFLKIAFVGETGEIPEELELTKLEENLPLLVVRELMRHIRGFSLIPSTKNGPEFGIYLGCKP